MCYRSSKDLALEGEVLGDLTLFRVCSCASWHRMLGVLCVFFGTGNPKNTPLQGTASVLRKLVYTEK